MRVAAEALPHRRSGSRGSSASRAPSRAFRRLRRSRRPHRLFLADRSGGFRALVAASALACIASPVAQAHGLTPLTGAEGDPSPPWHFAGLPSQTKPRTRFSVVELEGRRVLEVDANESFGNLVHPLDPDAAPATLAWQWRIERFNERADLETRVGDDVAIKVCALFDLPLDHVPFVERQVFRAMRGRAEEPLPSATLCYVWDAHLAPGTLLANAYTRRIRYIVLRSEADGTGRWQHEERHLAEDFHRAFGDESAEPVPLIGIAVGADADNTHAHTTAFVAGLALMR